MTGFKSALACACGVMLALIVLGAAQACGTGEGCREFPAHPEAQPPIGNLQLYPRADATEPLAIEPETGSIEVTETQVLINYTQAGTTHQIQYEIRPNN